MKKLLGFLALATLVVAIPSMVFAAEFRVSKDQNGSADVAKNETVKNLYIAGNTVNFSGAASSDLIAAGNNLNLSGPVAKDLFAAGSNINMSTKVSGNARLAGSIVSFSGAAEEDLFIGAGTASLSKESMVGGDLFAGVGTFTLDGTINGRARITGSDVTINGKIVGDLEVDASKLRLGDSAFVGGNLIYRAPEPATISGSAVIKGTTDFQKINTKKYSDKLFAGVLGIFGFFGLLMGIVLLFVLVYILPKSSKNLVIKTLSAFWANLGWGFLTFVVAPTALIILALTVIGLKLAGVLALLYIAFLIVAGLYGTLVIGAQTLKWFKKGEYRVDWLTILVGTLASLILGIIPILGGIVIFGVFIAVLGQILTQSVLFLKSQR